MKQKIDKHLQDFLEEFNLTEREVQLYLTLLRTGPNTIMNLSRETNIKRSTTHNNVEELVKKGLVSQTNYGERRMVIAEDPEKLKFLLEQKKWRVKKLEDNLPNVIGAIQKMVPESKDDNSVDVKYYSGTEGIKYIYSILMKINTYYSFADLEKYYKLFSEETPSDWNLIFESNPDRYVWDILVDTDYARKVVKLAHKNYHYKFLPKKEFFSGFDFADYIFFEDKVAIIQLNAEQPLATLIRSDHVARSLKALHQTMWELL